jgi:hypothetical protein
MILQKNQHSNICRAILQVLLTHAAYYEDLYSRNYQNAAS